MSGEAMLPRNRVRTSWNGIGQAKRSRSRRISASLTPCGVSASPSASSHQPTSVRDGAPITGDHNQRRPSYQVAESSLAAVGSLQLSPVRCMVRADRDAADS